MPTCCGQIHNYKDLLWGSYMKPMICYTCIKRTICGMIKLTVSFKEQWPIRSFGSYYWHILSPFSFEMSIVTMTNLKNFKTEMNIHKKVFNSRYKMIGCCCFVAQSKVSPWILRLSPSTLFFILHAKYTYIVIKV